VGAAIVCYRPDLVPVYHLVICAQNASTILPRRFAFEPPVASRVSAKATYDQRARTSIRRRGSSGIRWKASTWPRIISRHRVAGTRGEDLLNRFRVPDHATRTYSGRPRSNMRVQHACGDCDFSRLTSVHLRAQPVTNHPLPARHIGLDEGAPVVARRLLPAHAAALGDGLQMVVSPRRRGLGRCARHGARSWRHDDIRFGNGMQQPRHRHRPGRTRRRR
jgi:hypothetical protein